MTVEGERLERRKVEICEAVSDAECVMNGQRKISEGDDPVENLGYDRCRNGLVGVGDF